jgi:hypothetical protein
VRRQPHQSPRVRRGYRFYLKEQSSLAREAVKRARVEEEFRPGAPSVLRECFSPEAHGQSDGAKPVVRGYKFHVVLKRCPPTLTLPTAPLLGQPLEVLGESASLIS